MAGVRVGELLQVIRSLYPSPASLPQLIEVAGIEAVLDRRTDQLSGGQTQRVRFALAAAGDPQLLVLDEPTVAMDVEAREAFWSALGGYAAGGMTILFSTHDLADADTHAERIVVLSAGRVVADGSPDEVKSRAGVGRTIRFRSLNGSSECFGALAGVQAVQIEQRHVTLVTSDSDATLWALYDFREVIADLQISSGGLQEAILALTSH